MRSNWQKTTVLLGSLLLIALGGNSISTAPPPLPNPVIVFLGQEYYQVNGKQFTRYRYSVENRAEYPNELFAAAPALPPYGRNTSASRTWVDIYNVSGTRIYGFCALATPEDLGPLWFALESDVIPPSWVYIEMTDRQTGTKYKSNLADTTL